MLAIGSRRHRTSHTTPKAACEYSSTRRSAPSLSSRGVTIGVAATDKHAAASKLVAVQTTFTSSRNGDARSVPTWASPFPGSPRGFGDSGSFAPNAHHRGYQGQPASPQGTAGQPNDRPYPGYQLRPWHDGRYAPYESRGPYGHPDLLQRQRGRFDFPQEETQP